MLCSYSSVSAATGRAATRGAPTAACADETDPARLFVAEGNEHCVMCMYIYIYIYI